MFRTLILGVVVLCFMHFHQASAYVDHDHTQVSSELLNADAIKTGDDEQANDLESDLKSGEDGASHATEEQIATEEDIAQRLDNDEAEGSEMDDVYGHRADAPQVVHIEVPDLNPEKMHVLHTKIDTDHDGKISTVEFIEFWKKRERTVDLGHIDAVFEAVDKDADGKATMEEVLAKLGGLGSKVVELTPETDEEKVAETELKKAKFTAADLDGDGSLSKMEMFELGRSNREKNSIQALDVAHYVKGKDKNHDGELDAEEFFKITHLSKAEQEVDFKKLDVDGNGKLSPAEIGHWHTGVFEFSKIVAELFQVADKDADSFISFDELKAKLPDLQETDVAAHMHSWLSDEL